MDRGPLRPPARIGLIGTGVMGSGIGANIMAAGYPLTVCNRSRARAEDLLEAGAQWADTPGALAGASDAVITIVGLPSDVRDVYLGPAGVLAAAPPGSVAIDMTTSEPELARELAAAGEERDVGVLDAPVSGGDVGAREGTLSIMVGGAKDDFARALPLLESFGRTVVHQGPPGSGQHTKMANQVAIASTVLGVMEALAYVEGAGLDPERVLMSIGSGAAASWTMNNLYPRAARGDFAPGFAVRHFLKDMGIAHGAADAMGLRLEGLALAERLFEQLRAHGGGDLGTQALVTELRRAE